MADRDCHVETELRTDRKRPFNELRNGVALLGGEEELLCIQQVTDHKASKQLFRLGSRGRDRLAGYSCPSPCMNTALECTVAG